MTTILTSSVAPSAGEFSLTLYGADASVWPLAGPHADGRLCRLMEGELSQLYLTPSETTYRPRVGVGGAVYRGGRDLPAMFLLRIDAIGDVWAQTFARLRRAIRPDADAVLEMHTSAGARRLVIREHEGARVLNEHDPGARRAVMLEFPVIAPDPYWTALQPYTSEWVASTYQITGELVVSNPGEVAAWPRYICTAPAGWILPDVDLDDRDGIDAPRVVELPWLPAGRDVLVDTDPGRLTVEAVDETLAPLAGLRGQRFIHSIPAGAHEVRLPVAIDPIPGLQLAIPDEWRHWIALRLQDVAEAIGAGDWSSMTPEVVGQRVESLIRGAHPEWLPDLTDGLVAKLTASAIAEAWRNHYGRWGVVDGSTVQVQIWPKWRSPW